jgi:PAS domain S-box-containing protein
VEDGSRLLPVARDSRDLPLPSIAPPSAVPSSGVQGAMSGVRPISSRRAPAFIDDEAHRPAPLIPEKVADDGGPDLLCATADMPSVPRTPPASLDFALLRGALEEIPLGVATTRSGQILYANGTLERIFGASPGGLEQKHVSMLFDQETFLRISNQLDEARVFDGRVKTQSFDGRAIDAEVHVEWYMSETLGIGGFIVFRDVSLELGALGRLIDQLGGVLFRIRVEGGVLEYCSPAIGQLTGLDSSTCAEHPVLLTNLVTAEERERMAFLYRRVAEGEILTASAQLSLRRPDGRVRALYVRATGRRDTSGVVRHIDGVVTDVSREVQEATYAAQIESTPPTSTRPPPRRRATPSAIAPAVMELAQELLREASQHLHTLGRAIGLAQLELGTPGEVEPESMATEISDRLDVMARSFAAASSLTRRVRHALAGAASSAPFGDVLEHVRTTLAPVIGDSVITVHSGDAASVLLEQRVDEMTLVITYLSLRAFRFAGSGSLQIEARRVALQSTDPRMRSRLVPHSAEMQDTLIVIAGGAHPESSLPGTDISSDILQTIPRRADADQAFNAAKSLLAACNATIESDEVTLDEACTVIRLRG